LKNPTISVVIPVRNGAATLHRCLSSLRNQSIGKPIEIIIEDSMSTDASREIAASFGAKVFDVAEGLFNHGLTRNSGVRHASGELIFLTVQDAWAERNDLLEKMAAHFADPNVTAVTGHQAVPHEKSMNPVLWYRPTSAPKTTERVIAGIEAFERLSPSEQQDLISWDDVVAMYRRKALIEQPFVATEYAEDRVWSYEAVLKGWKLLHDSSLVMYHYHHQSYNYAFRLNYTAHHYFYKYFNLKPKLRLPINPIARATYHLIKHRDLSTREKAYWFSYNVAEKIALYMATLNIIIRLKFRGMKGSEAGYQKYCKKIPQGTLKE